MGNPNQQQLRVLQVEATIIISIPPLDPPLKNLGHPVAKKMSLRSRDRGTVISFHL
jgi:hypothetical protein